MNFEEELKKMMSQTDGAKAAVLMGFDGISVAEVQNETQTNSSQDLLVECGQLLSQATKVFQAANLGNMEEMTFTSEKLRLVLRVLNSNYFVGMFLDSDGNVGKARYLMRIKGPEIQTQL